MLFICFWKVTLLCTPLAHDYLEIVDNSLFFASIIAVWAESFCYGKGNFRHYWIIQKGFHFVEDISGYSEDWSKEHRINIFLQQKWKNNNKLLRWRIGFAEYRSSIEYRSGCKNKGVDAQIKSSFSLCTIN